MARVAGQMVRILRDFGVRRNYGIVGDSLNPVVDVMRRTEGIEWVQVRHEETGAFSPTTHLSLELGLLLAVVGGFLDAFTYIGHGHVFANAMSGNVVLVGVSVVAGHWRLSVRNLMVILAFLAGVASANLLHLPRVSTVVRRPELAGLLLELAFLLVVGGLPAGWPDLVTTVGIAFVAAVQTSTFRKLGDWPYSSVMTTGNLRSFGDATVAWLSHGDRTEIRKVVYFGTTCSAFLGGAMLGAACTAQWGNHAAWLTAVLIGIAVLRL